MQSGYREPRTGPGQAWPPGPGDRVLDIGCGFGDATQQLAALVGPDGRATGVDVSEPFIQASIQEAVNLLGKQKDAMPAGVRAEVYRGAAEFRLRQSGPDADEALKFLKEASGAVTHTDNKPGQNTKDDQSCKERDEQEEHRFSNHVYTDHQGYRGRANDKC